MMPNQTTRATAQSSGYQPYQAKWNSMAGVTEGNDDSGYWSVGNDFDWSQRPDPNASPYWDENGRMAGWTTQGYANQNKGGSGLFGDFGKATDFQTWEVDPTTGQLSNPYGGTIDPNSKSGGTKFMSYAMPIAMMAGLGAGAAGGAFSGVGGMTAAEGAALGSEAAGGITGIGAGGTTAAEAATAAGLGTSGAGGLSLEAASMLPEAAGAVTGNGAGMAPILGGTNGSTAFSGLSSIQQISELMKQGMNVKDAISMISGGQGNGQQTGKGNTSILDLLGGYYSGQQMKDYSGNMKGIYSDLNNRQDQFRDQLLRSYQDPETFYGSNQWKGLESVYQNQIDRNAAKSGRLANPTDREVLLQKYGMQELEKFRSGLRDAAGLTKPEAALDPLAKGYQAEAYANTAPWATVGRGGTGTTGSVQDVVGALGDGAKSVEDIWKFIEGWFN